MLLHACSWRLSLIFICITRTKVLMDDRPLSQDQLLQELQMLRQRVEALQQAEADRRRAEEALKQVASRLSILREIDRAILEARSLETIAGAALSHIQALVPCQMVAFVTFDPAQQAATVFAVDAVGAQVVPAGASFPLEAFEVASEALETLRRSEVYVVEAGRLMQAPPVVQVLQSVELEVIAAAPLIARQELLGCLGLGVQSAPDEAQLETLREVADLMAIALAQARLVEDMQHHTAELEQRVTERTAALEEANRHLRELDHLKDEFIANVSHELRTPIASLRIYHTLLKLRPERSAAYIATLERETNRLHHIVEDLLYMSGIERRPTAPPWPLVDLNTLVGLYVMDRTVLAEGRGLALRLETEAGLPKVRADREQIERTLSILLTNALNYTPHGGQIVVRTHTRQAEGSLWVGFSVSDTGPGIPPEELALVWERFFRGRVGHMSGIPGTGLGLAIAREIVGQHGGQIEVSSEGKPGRGAVFAVWLPVDKRSLGDSHL